MSPPGARLVASASFAVLFGLVLWLAGRPLATNDLWWHLRMGQAYAEQGPWLEADPSLHTAPSRPPEPAAWLFAVGVHGVESGLGFAGLRGLHALLAAAIGWLAFSIFRRQSADPTAACLGCGIFLVLAWPRLMQLRPDLASLLATLGLYRLVLEPREAPGWGRVVWAAWLIGLWANTHALFMLGPCLLLAALAGCGLGELLSRSAAPPDAEALSRNRRRAARIGAALGLGLLAALANPRGIHQHLSFVTSAGEGAIQLVRDDWKPFHPLHWDRYGLAAGWLEWLCANTVLVLFALCAVAGLLGLMRRPTPRTPEALDPVLLGLGAASLVAAGSAVRFLWLAVFPLLFVLRAHAGLVQARPALAAPSAWALAGSALFLALALPQSKAFAGAAAGLPRHPATYLHTPYAAQKFHEPGVRFLEEAGLEGNLYNAYGRGGFLGYRLAPRLRTFVDGGMNVENEVFRDYWSIAAQRGALPGESFLDVLERRRVDLFFGVGAPGSGTRDADDYTAAHLEGAAGWLPVARGLDHAIYLRANPRNAENLERVAAWYGREGVPFDREHGLDVSQIVGDHADWAVQRGMLPAHTPRLLARRRSADPAVRFGAENALARIYLQVGAYREQVAAEREAIALEPGAVAPRRRLVVGLLRLGRFAEARTAAEALGRLSPPDPHAARFVDAAREYARRQRAELPLAAVVQGLPLSAALPPGGG